jgi:hypothetical protein
VTATEVKRGGETEERGLAGEARGETHVDILGQQLVCRLVLLQDVVVDATAGECRAEQEAKQPNVKANGQPSASQPSTARSSIGDTHPPRKAPMGFRAGRGAAGAASSSRAEVWKDRVAAAERGVERARAPDETNLEAIGGGLWLPLLEVGGRVSDVGSAWRERFRVALGRTCLLGQEQMKVQRGQLQPIRTQRMPARCLMSASSEGQQRNTHFRVPTMCP